MYDTSDEFRFAYQQVTGDLDIRVRTTSLENVNSWSKAGVMIRESLDANARNAFMLVSPGRGRAFQARTTTGGTTTRTSAGAGTAPVWLRLVRQGNVFTGYLSTDGASWTSTGSSTINMAAAAYVGLAVTSRVDSSLATATFTSLQVAAGPAGTGLPAPWSKGDIGSPALPGSASAAGGTFTVRGAGTNVWSTTDQFQFVSQPLQGDVEIIARVASLHDANAGSKAGVMIRETLTGPSRHAFLLASGGSGWAFHRRILTGGSSYHLGGPGTNAPGWVRLVREGNLFTAYHSTDGTTWALVGTDTIAMASTVYVGLAVTSVNPSGDHDHHVHQRDRPGADAGDEPAADGGPHEPGAGGRRSPRRRRSRSTPRRATPTGRWPASTSIRARSSSPSDTTNPYSATWSNAAAGTLSVDGAGDRQRRHDDDLVASQRRR